MTVVMMMAAVSTGFRFKGRLLIGDAGTQTGQHVSEHRIPAYTQKAIAHFGLRVAITQMEGAAQQRLAAIAGDPAGRFGGGSNFDDATIIPLEQIPVSEHRTAYGKYSDFFAGGEGGTQTTFFAQLVRKHELAINPVSVSNFGVQSKHVFFQRVIRG